MNILHVNHSDTLGGAARSAYRIHQELGRRGFDSKMMVGRKYSHDSAVKMIGEKYSLWILDSAFSRISNWLGLQYLYCPSSFLFARDPWFSAADIVQLYNLHGDYFSHTVLPTLTKAKPIVWRFSDMWPLTGHCSYSYDCNRWQNGCGKCPILHDYPSISIDTTAFLWNLKKKIFQSCENLALVAPSRWMANLIKASPIFNQFHIETIPNGIDTSVFSPIEKQEAKGLIGIGSNRDKVILFSAHSLADKRKGLQYFKESLHRVREKCESADQIQILLVGSESEKIDFQVPFRVKIIDHARDAADMKKIYSAADLFVFCSLAENLPNSVLESMACKTPVIAFSEGGSKEIIQNESTGILVDRADALALGDQIIRALQDQALTKNLAANALRIVQENFSVKQECDRYEKLYQNLILRFSAKQTRGGKQH